MTHPTNSGFNPNKNFTKEIYADFRQGIIDEQSPDSLKDGIELKVVMKIRELLSHGQKKEAADLMISITEDILDKNETGYDKKLLINLYMAVNELSPYLFTKDMGDRILNYLMNSEGPEADKLKESLKCLVKHGLYDKEWITRYASNVKTGRSVSTASTTKISNIDKELSKTTITESGLERINSIRNRCLGENANLENIHILVNERFYEDYRRLKEANTDDAQIQERLTNSIVQTLKDLTHRVGKAKAARCMIEIHQTISNLKNTRTNTFNSELLQKIMDRLNSEDSPITSYDIGMNMIANLVDPQTSTEKKDAMKERLKALVVLGYFPIEQLQKEALTNRSQELFDMYNQFTAKSQSSKAPSRIANLESILSQKIPNSSLKADTASSSSNESISSRPSSIDTREKGPLPISNLPRDRKASSEEKSTLSGFERETERLQKIPLNELKNLAKNTFDRLSSSQQTKIRDAIFSSYKSRNAALLSYSIGSAARDIDEPAFRVLYQRLVEKEAGVDFQRASNDDLKEGTSAFAQILNIPLR
ncbi:MAG: hypothetical protein FJZ56_00395 [Chlamydiae bacterium]|nr:hypothetical protein [Chlamydiota bacterium]